MDINKLKATIENGKIQWQRHALERMMEKGISRNTVKKILLSGELIEDYPDDKPYPSNLILGFRNKRPLHLVVAKDNQTGQCIMVTVYEPDKKSWSLDFKFKIK